MFHLVRRFFGFLTARPLTPIEQAFVRDSLTAELRRLFYEQRVEDQRHAIDVASLVESDPDLIEAALLHDIGKTRAHLGAIERSLATIWIATSLPIWGDWLLYREHGPIGAELLEAHGAGDLAVSFARYHPGEPPASCNRSRWIALENADHA
jgi:putative nucleotidyltransferase with HDIG domain